MFHIASIANGGSGQMVYVLVISEQELSYWKKRRTPMNFSMIYRDQIEKFLIEDELDKQPAYIQNLPADEVKCCLKFKDEMVVAGIPFFKAVFEVMGTQVPSTLDEWEGRAVSYEQVEFNLPFNIALSGERLALNMLQRASAIATFTQKMVKAVNHLQVIDTRKTTPGLRFLEKYAVQVGGGKNHRFSQTDIWMIKDNHKNFFGGVQPAIEFFQKSKGFYQPIVLEIHKLEEIAEGFKHGVNHFLLDNFSPEEIKQAIEIKQAGMTYEVSGGITLENLASYDIEGVDCVSSGSLTYNAPHVDISLKINE